VIALVLALVLIVFVACLASWIVLSGPTLDVKAAIAICTALIASAANLANTHQARKNLELSAELKAKTELAHQKWLAYHEVMRIAEQTYEIIDRRLKLDRWDPQSFSEIEDLATPALEHGRTILSEDFWEDWSVLRDELVSFANQCHHEDNVRIRRALWEEHGSTFDEKLRCFIGKGREKASEWESAK